MPVESEDACVPGIEVKRAHAASDAALTAACAERDRLKAQLAAETLDFNAALDEGLAGWWSWSVAERSGEFSPGFRARLGLGDAPLDSANAAVVASAIDGWLAADDTGPLDATLTLAHADGHPVRCDLHAEVIERAANGTPVSILGGNVDLAQAFRIEQVATERLAAQTTELAALNEAMEKQAEQLRRSNSALEDFAYAASHDLQTPLRAIAHFATWIDEDLPADSGKEVREHVVRLLDRVERLGQLHRDLLAYARVNHTQIRWVMDDIRLLVQAAWTRQGQPEFDFVVEGEVGEVRVPQTQVRAVLDEALSNAVRHHDRAPGRVCVRLTRIGDVLQIEVEDDGPGIEPRFAEQAFKVLETLRPRDAGAGSGMGLPIARRHARRVRGDLTLLEREGRGAVFVLRFPVAST